MTGMWWIWIKHRWRGLSAVACVLLAVLIVVLIVMDVPDLGVSVFGNAAAPRASANGTTAGIVLPRSSDPGAPVRAAPDQNGDAPDPKSSLLDRGGAREHGPQSIAAAQAAWTPAEVRAHQHEVLAAVNCARLAQRQPALALDPALTATAADAWLRLVNDRAFDLMDLPGGYALRIVIALDTARGGAAEDAPADMPDGQGTPRCGVSGFDAATLPVAPAGTAIGIAVFPPQASWDSSSAVVLIR